ncbi:MAG: HipA domain-containing protein [Alphaproteobacteria bacterium]|nr:HipA domain-containing protein [Alphaproteobacteria bacterium]
MTSDAAYREAFVWVWLPGATTPVVAGRLDAIGGQLIFTYGRSYLARPEAIPLYEPELPLRPGPLPLLNGLAMPSAIRDGAPDAWGRRVIINRKLGAAGKAVDPATFDELTFLLESGSDRIGALDFQASPTLYVPRESGGATLDELLSAAESVENGVPLSPELDLALLHGSSIGGARPKALIDDGDTKYIAKFSSQNDLYAVVKAEFVAMRLAAKCGLDVAPVMLRRTAGKDVLLIERFDRTRVAAGWRRHILISALTLLELDEMNARYASYEDFATIVRHRFVQPKQTLRELFARLVFNILCGNTDDHARNHAAFWTGRDLELTPAYDICPQARAGGEAGQAMLIRGTSNLSRLDICLAAAPGFLLGADDAQAIAAAQIRTIRNHWDETCDEAGLTPVDRALMWRRQFLNPFAFEGSPELQRLLDAGA